MSWTALNCPQCSAPLPRVALWRSVNCASCGALITRSESIVKRDTFRQALIRAQATPSEAGQLIRIGRQDYLLLEPLGSGTVSQVFLARRTGPMPLLVTLKLSANPSASDPFLAEADALRALHQTSNEAAAAFFSMCLPEVVGNGVVENRHSRHALVLRHPIGYWGSLDALNARFPQGLDPRHGIWIWRRLLEVLGVIHSLGWAHGDIRPEHGLIHPGDHAIRLIGWSSARQSSGSNRQAADLQHSARIISILLNGDNRSDTQASRVPAELTELVEMAANNLNFCLQHGALGLDSLLQAAARSSFGPPAFIPLSF